MNLQQLEHVDAVSRHRSLRAASEALGVTPQALSRSIAALERELAAPIFERQPGGVIFTPFGVRLHEKVLQALRLRDQIAERGPDTTSRSLAVGMGYLFSTSRLAALACMAFDELGYDRVDYVTGANVHLAPRVAAGELDFAFTSETSETRRLVFTPYLEFGWLVACRADHPVARSGDLGDVSRYGFVAAPSPTGHASIEQATRALSGRPAAITATADGVTEMLRMLQASDRLALVPETLCEDLRAWAGLTLLPAPDLPRRSYGVLSQRRPPVGLDWDALSAAFAAMFADVSADTVAGSGAKSDADQGAAR